MGIIRDLFNFFFCDCDKESIINVNISGSANITQNHKGVFVNGKLLYRHKDNVRLNIYVLNNSDKIDIINGDVVISGSVTNSVSVTNGNVDVQLYVGGNVKTVNGDIHCGIVRGTATSGVGDIITLRK